MTLCAPLLLHHDLPRGSDVFAAGHYLQSFSKALGEGDLFPRWTDRSNDDLGAPMFVFYPPLTYYGASLALVVTGSVVAAFKLYLVALALASALAFYALARDWIGAGTPAALAATVYLLLPYHVLDMYQRFALAESTAFVFLPLVPLFARRVYRMGRGRDLGGLALAWAGLLFTHLISAFMLALFLLPWLVWEGRVRLRGLWRPLLGLVCGAALAAPFWLPALLEREHVNLAWAREMPNGDYRINFIFRDEVLPGLGIKDPVKPHVLRSAHAQLLLAAIAWWIARRRVAADRRGTIAALGLGCLATYLLQLRISTPLWELVPELPTIQFPWRFQTLMVLVTALLVGFALDGLARGGGGWWRRPREALALGVLLAALALDLSLASQTTRLKPFDFDESRARDTAVVRWRQPALTPVQLRAYREFQRARVEMPRAGFREGSGRIVVESWLSSSRRLSVSTAGGGTVELRSFWFPGWRATRDGEPLALQASSRGVVRFSLPPGDHSVELVFGRTTARNGGRAVGALGWLLLPVSAWLLGRARR